ncbi:MAG: hypothetical protein KME43_05760 [Myxacorys chilensis ATA2-1-KO14]|jgi:hypothetical protein|nr:hypothetical protein [Myxacorys chilensis ATA2-1-KO14]
MSLELQSLTSQSAAALDRFAWNAICNWSKHTSVVTIYNGIDYAELTRCFLWDKVARAIRQQTNSDQFEFDRVLPPTPLTPHPNRLKFWLKRSLKLLQMWQDVRSLQSSQVLYVPCAHPTLQSVVKVIAQSESITVVAPQGAFDSALNIQTIRPPLLLDLPNLAHVEALHQGILEGLGALGVELLEPDVIVLRHQIAQLLLRTEQIETELSILRPNAILVFADNHFPVQSYVFVARKYAIPSIMLQHGLDCEQHCLDEAYADVISVWGDARLQRYQQDSTWQPSRLQANGNPEYDGLMFPNQLDRGGEYWLWTTRPHCPEKCYIPSRTPQEGIQILQALLTALEQSPTAHLVIKPHPLDDIALYQTYINAHPLSDRVTLSTGLVRSLIPNASVVISEDSTVGLEAMFFGKVVIHAHFAVSDPVLPFVKYNAALPGFSPETLQTSLQQIEQLSEKQQQDLLEGQRQFLQQYAGVCDGKAQERVTSMIQTILEQ